MEMKPSEVKLDEQDSRVTMNDLPVLPFEKILSYLSLEDLIKSRAVSSKWCKWINSFKVKSLCFSNRSSCLISGALAQNFIRSPKFESFCDTFGWSILTNLKHLRLCKLEPDRKTFAQILNTFDRLEELDLFHLELLPDSNFGVDLELNLPMLKSFQFEDVYLINHLTLNAPRLQKIKILDLSTEFSLVHGESVKELITFGLNNVDVEKLRNLKYLYCFNTPCDST